MGSCSQFRRLLAACVLLLSLVLTQQSPLAQNYSSGILRMAKAAQIHAYIDPQADYCDDFYQFACGRWHNLQRTSAKRPRTAYLDQLEDLYVRKSADMLQNGRELDNSADRKLTQFFESCRNEAVVKQVGLEPIFEVVDFRGGWPSIASHSWYEYEYDWLKVVAALRRQLGVDILIGLEVVDDFEEADMTRLKIGAPKLPLGIKEHYLDDSYDDERDEYRESIEEKLHKHFPNMGEKWAEEVAKQVLDIERNLAKGLPESNKLTMPQMTRQRFVSELKSAYGNYVDLNRYLTLVLNETIYSKVYETPDEYMPNLVEVVRDTPKLHIANYTMWRVLEHLGFADEINQPSNDMWCVRKIISYFPAQLQSMFNRNYNSLTMVNELQSTWADIKRAFHDELSKSDQLEWISQKTRQHGIQKLEKIRLKLIVYEDMDLADKLSELDINPGQYYSNLINILAWQTKHKLQVLFTKPQPEQAQVRLPRYNPTNNHIEIPVTFLQSRFFSDAAYPHALRYATLGFLLAHEMLRAFDASGRRYDQYGYQRSWWDAASTQAYDERAKCFATNHYNKFNYRDLNLFSAQAEEESILDSGALAIAQRAYQQWWENVADREDVLNKETLPLLYHTPQHLFFIGFAQLWCADYHDSVEKFEELPEPLRVNGAIAHNDGFAREMKCKLGSRMHPAQKFRSNRNSPQEKRKCSPESKEDPKASTKTAEQRRDKQQQHQQQQQQQIQQIKTKEMQQKDMKKVKTAVASQKNVSNGKVAAKECTTTALNDEQQGNSTTDTNNRVGVERQVSKSKNILKFEGTEDGNQTHGCRWQWRRSRTRLDKEQQKEQEQEQEQLSTSKILQVYKRHADEQLSNTVSRVMTTMRTTNGSS